MEAKPIQLDELPEQWDRRAAQRVLESAVRRLTDERVPDPIPATRVPPAEPVDLLPWVL